MQDNVLDSLEGIAGWVGAIIVVLALIAGSIAFSTTVIWAAWNFVGSPMFTWPTLEYWQAALIGTVVGMVTSSVKATVKK